MMLKMKKMVTFYAASKIVFSYLTVPTLTLVLDVVFNSMQIVIYISYVTDRDVVSLGINRGSDVKINDAFGLFYFK